MHRLQVDESGAMRTAIQQEIGRSAESRYDHRLHGLLLLAGGCSCGEVAALFGEDETTVQRWAHRFRQGGLQALREIHRPGRPRTLKPGQWCALQEDLRKSPLDFGLTTTTWNGLSLSEHLRRRFGVRLGVRQCQRVFRQMGLRTRTPGDALRLDSNAGGAADLDLPCDERQPRGGEDGLPLSAGGA